MLRRTKIVTTLGPTTDRDGNLEKIIRAGANVVRMNFSHGSAEDHIKRANQVRELAKKYGINIGILGDLQGPKIRIACFKNDSIELAVGDKFTLDSSLGEEDGDQDAVGLGYKTLPQECESGDVLLLDDGRIQLQVESTDGKNRVECRVIVGGKLSNRKGINKKGGGLSAAALTEKDKRDIKLAAEIGCDFLAVSFPRSGEDLKYARQLAKAVNFEPQIVAKVERAETIETEEAMMDIIENADIIMVARGDLGVEIGDPQLIGVQKKLIGLARHSNRAVITATQMMESMMNAPLPTRAEVMDVANAVLDGTDAVMLSGETAAGQFPEETVQSMASVCLGAESHRSVNISNHRMNYEFDAIEETVSMSAMYAANHLKGVAAIVACTESGHTVKMMSRISSGLPIIGLSRTQETLNRMAIYRGVEPIFFDSAKETPESISQAVCDLLKQKELVKPGDRVIFTKGDIMGRVGKTNGMKVLTVE